MRFETSSRFPNKQLRIYPDVTKEDLFELVKLSDQRKNKQRIKKVEI